jgi:hypothetical protein
MRGLGYCLRMRCAPIAGFLVIVLALGVVPPARGQQMTEEEKKALFLKAREDIRPVPATKPTPRPTPRSAGTPRATPRTTPRPVPPRSTAPDKDDFIPLEGDRTPRASTPERTPTPKQPAPRATARPSAPKSTPRATPAPRRSPAPRKEREAPITIEKSGASEQRGLQPAPRQGGGGWFKRYRYLTPAIRRAIDKAPVSRGRWQYIVIHNSATRQGNARIFDRYHRNVRKMTNGLAYHFVIGNGNASGNGEIEIGSRWTRQINGGHVASDYLNNIAIGICLVGDFDRDLPTRAQVEALKELTDYVRNRVGRVKGNRRAAVRGHKEINPRPTTCPGKRFDLRWLRRTFRD